ncbi:MULTISPECIES: PAS domain-containing protein [Bacillaceae]|uniref:histidine kinase n=1 Tax=Evansella alkalicola TaxID=745819 RepID=A0ABS6JUC7_9BACI|nr:MULTISPECIES: PAS domain S-box protein [Bacillaceae]MBU9720837.1 PAS domain S-box protein [Bacillus alkalicola]
MVTNKAEMSWMKNADSIVNNQQEQQDNFELMSQTFDFISDAILIVDKAWKLIYTNEAAAKLLRSSKRDLLGVHLWDKFSDNVRTTFFDSYQKSLLEDKPVEFNEYYTPLKMWLHFKVIPSKGRVTILLNKLNDNLTMEVTEEVYRTMFRDYPDAVCSTDLRGYFLTVNKSFKEMFSVDDENIKGKHFLDYLVGNRNGRIKDIFETAINGNPQTVEINLSNEVGRPFVVMLSLIPIIVNSEIIGAYAIFKNITKYYLNVDEIRRLYDMNQSIMEAVEDGILGLDKDFNVVMWNEAAEKITGYDREELTPETIHKLLHHIQPSIDHFFNKDFNSLNLFEEIVIEKSGITFYKKDGTPFITEFTVTPMISGETVIGSVLTFRDITQKKKSEELIHQSEKLSAVGQLAAGIAHEIRNPLTSLKGFLQLIEFNQGGKQEYYDIMKSEFSRIEQILNELLILSKPQKMDKVPTSIVNLMDHTVTLLQTQAIIKNIQIKKDIQAEDAMVECAEHQIKQVFVNLIKNAIEATDDGGEINVLIRAINQEVTVEVVDTGCGIPKEKLKRIGEPFFTTKNKGTGLGLMVTFQIIEEHGGTVEVDSIEGEGTTFKIKLPLYES